MEFYLLISPHPRHPALISCQAGFRVVVSQKDEKKKNLEHFPGGPVIKTQHFHHRGHRGSTPGWETKIPHTIQPKQTNKQKQNSQGYFFKKKKMKKKFFSIIEPRVHT